ncbi:MAG TPA: HDOD domain-containing protein [Terriglobales bacterium]|jgi:HD-like signal output (HDOD) protein
MSKNQKYYPWLALQQYTELSPARRTNQKAHGTAIPDVPVLTTTLLRLEKLLGENAPDLNAIGAVVRGDLGLTIHLLCLSHEEIFESQSAGVLPSIEEIVVHLGIEKFKKLIKSIPVLTEHPSGEIGVNICARFWMHSHLIALIAEELAVGESEITPGDAYLTGLLHQIGKLPILLGWRIPEFEATDLGELGYALARAWNFPSVLASVIRGHEEATDSLPSYLLWKISNSATEWVQLMEMMLAGGCDTK